MVFFYWSDGAERVLPSIALAVARFVALLVALGIGALVVDTPLVALAAAESPLARLGLRLIGVATLALLTHVVWISIRTAIDQRLSRIRPVDPLHHQPDENARLLTLLPLLRVTAAVILVVMLVLSSLWALGIQITPVLAGAGVVGLAIGFGAQALVRDVISGIFYLAEDAFRIGEYIEAGSNTKGTVERITLRTVALRHHNGPLHFVPYGSLGTVRNLSRDWVVFKFNLPLPLDIDSEKVRKLIKKVGEEMQADPEVGPLLMETLKGKLYRVDPGVKIFRCKFRTAPGRQFDVRAQAYKRIEEALKKMDVRFADGRLPVLTKA
jgi:small-conductance mechanosensitive channel